MANIISNIIQEGSDFRFGFVKEKETSINFQLKTIEDLDKDQKTTITSFEKMIQEQFKTTVQSILCQVSQDQHMSEERIIVRLEKEDEVRIITVKSLDKSPSANYAEYKAMVDKFVN